MNKKNKEIISYIFFGGLTVFINIVAYWIFYNYLNLSLVLSNTLAWIVAVIFAFITNKLFVFNSKTANKVQFFKEISSFFMFRLLSYLIDMSMMFFMVTSLSISDMISKIIVNIVVIIFNYIASKLFIFKTN